LKERIPYTRYLPSAIDPFPGGYVTAFDTYEEAIQAIEEWNAIYPEREKEYLVALENWRAECERLRADAYSRAVVEVYGEEPYEPVRVYSEDLGIWIDGWKYNPSITTVTKLPPDYKLPAAPKFDDTGFSDAKSAYYYLLSDGLTRGEWVELRVVILNIKDVQTDSPIFDEKIEGKIGVLIGKDYIIINERDESFFDEITGKLGEIYEVEYSDEGYHYFWKLIKRSWEFRKGLITSAYDDEVITKDEYDNLLAANDKIKKELIRQLDKKKDWHWRTGKTSFDTRKLPGGLIEAYMLFDVDSTVRSTEGRFPYNRVLENVPVPKDIEKLEGFLYTTEPFPDK
jgi:hypothetical protein